MPSSRRSRHRIQKELAKLEKRAASLEKEYRGSLELLRDARRAAAHATTQSERRTRELDAARSEIRSMAAGSYMNGGATPSSPCSPRTDAPYAAALTKIKAAQREIDDLTAQRKGTKKLLANYKPEVPERGRPDGVSGMTESPLAGPPRYAADELWTHCF